MKDFSKILVPVDGSKKSFQALDRALTLAGFTHGEVTCIHVIPEIPSGGPRTKEMDRQFKEDGNIVLKKATKRAGKNTKFKTRLVRGSPNVETIKIARNGKFDHIVMSTTGKGGSTGDMLGSVSNYVLHKSKIPVYLIK
ncbi:MAG: universal stress protein [Nitrosopumilaceae archaeon]|jgi:nucleotide-binding universal stress UspA family protein|uniref:Universal stress protein n=3 Tax=Candidatus Nitrosomaritimum aestuariumsis TaxID=3342354 RepID=A0AC60W4H9_9ARCH|nr:universal stress protein [Nitrosopumilaceae archaeon]MBA4454416.1 universal stress protein [Nitrosopumilaceae archaeon]MBA4460238.1 universal stress protein [Nitrosopumilaceae archaeon]MBA4461172.1 universal stress protein [Nitrosopumilaceae archaeon]MBA4463874.1 universal stress protein [Nitrosopumilaceae archaeon]